MKFHPIRFLFVTALFGASGLTNANSAQYSPAAGPGQIISLSAATLDRSGFLEITGTNFGADGTVLIDGISASVADWDDARIVAYVPETARLTTVPVAVVNGSGIASNSVDLTVTARQANGRVNWRFRQNGPYSKVRPVIAPDGTIYTVDVYSHLYALTPEGGLKWLVRGAGSQGVAVGQDGSVYTASATAIKAFHPDGSPKWTFNQNPGALFLVGISVGPDGNIYVVATEGIGTFSLTPNGTLRWARPELYDATRPVDYGEIIFGTNGSTPQLYFYANHHLRSYHLDGTEQFTLYSIFGQPSVAPNGSIHGSFAAFSPVNGSTQWFFSSPYPYNEATPSDIGADGTHYFVQNLGELFALNANGTERWHRTLGEAFAGPIVDPANKQLILGSATTLDNAGYIVSESAQDGHEMWRVNLPAEDGFNQSTDTRARFRPDGTAAYMITFTATGDNDTSRSFVYSLNTALGPIPTSAVSRKSHGAAGTFDIDLPLTGARGIECRLGSVGGAHQVVVTFANPVTMSGAAITSGTGTATATVNGAVVTVDLAQVTDGQWLNLKLNSVNDGLTTGDVVIPLGILLGDTSWNGTVAASDVGQTKAQSGASVTGANFRSDVNASGTITAADVSLVKSKSGTNLP